MSSSKLANFLVHLTEDHAALARYQKDPEAAIAAAGLSDKEIAALKTKDSKVIQETIIAGFPANHPISTAARPKLSITITLSITISI